jgi:hypothetical protein
VKKPVSKFAFQKFNLYRYIWVLGRDLTLYPKLIHPLPPSALYGRSSMDSPGDDSMDGPWNMVGLYKCVLTKYKHSLLPDAAWKQVEFSVPIAWKRLVSTLV